MGCNAYDLLADYEYVELYRKQYNPNLSKEEKKRIKNIPLLKAVISQEVFPTLYAIYIGHFYDKYMGKCKEGWKRLVITGKRTEIKLRYPASRRFEVINSGFIISHWRYTKPPYKIELKNHRITINGVLYVPNTEAEAEIVTPETDGLRVHQFQALSKLLKRNKVIIYSANYELSRQDDGDILIKELDNIFSGKALKNREEKKALEKLLETTMPEEAFEEFLNNWSK